MKEQNITEMTDGVNQNTNTPKKIREIEVDYFGFKATCKLNILTWFELETLGITSANVSEYIKDRPQHLLLALLYSNLKVNNVEKSSFSQFRKKVTNRMETYVRQNIEINIDMVQVVSGLTILIADNIQVRPLSQKEQDEFAMGLERRDLRKIGTYRN